MRLDLGSLILFLLVVDASLFFSPSELKAQLAVRELFHGVRSGNVESVAEVIQRDELKPSHLFQATMLAMELGLLDIVDTLISSSSLSVDYGLALASKALLSPSDDHFALVYEKYRLALVPGAPQRHFVEAAANLKLDLVESISHSACIAPEDWDEALLAACKARSHPSQLCVFLKEGRACPFFRDHRVWAELVILNRKDHIKLLLDDPRCTKEIGSAVFKTVIYHLARGAIFLSSSTRLNEIIELFFESFPDLSLSDSSVIENLLSHGRVDVALVLMNQCQLTLPNLNADSWMRVVELSLLEQLRPFERHISLSFDSFRQILVDSFVAQDAVMTQFFYTWSQGHGRISLADRLSVLKLFVELYEHLVLKLLLSDKAPALEKLKVCKEMNYDMFYQTLETMEKAFAFGSLVLDSNNQHWLPSDVMLIILAQFSKL